MEQMPLFLDEFVLFNNAANALNDLRLDEAASLLTDYRHLYPASSEDVDEKLTIAGFLLEKLSALPNSGPELPGLLFRTWRSFEVFCAGLKYNSRTPEALRPVFFRRITNAIEGASLPDDSFIDNNIPIGYSYIQTGDYRRAVRSLQTALLTLRDNAALFGYLGDAWWGRGNPDTARQLYLEACLIDSRTIDWPHLRDHELGGLLASLPDLYGWSEPDAREWLPACAYIRGILKPKMLRALEELTVFTEEFLRAQKALGSSPDDVACAARFFIKAIILCDNEPFLRHVRGIDFGEIRREMRKAEPRLFAEYLKEIDRRLRI
jgi:tetratricopeptide (TPR) repeat protein